MYINWSLGRLNVLATVPVAAAVLVWPSGAGEFETRVTQAGVITAQADDVNRITQLGVVAAQGDGFNQITQLGATAAQGDLFNRITQVGAGVAQADYVIRVTQVGVVLITKPIPPPPCVGEVLVDRTDGLPYTPAIPDPCAGDGIRSGSRSGA